MKKMKKKQVIRKPISIKKVVLSILTLVFAIAFIISLYNIIMWNKMNKQTKEQIDKINDVAEIEEHSDNENTEVIEPSEDIDEENPYWDYIKMDLLNVNFDQLKNINNETKGWINVQGTNINYPFVQTSNNDYYLTHSFDRSYNRAGWVFMDYRNNPSEYDQNTIIYAHGRLDNTMFGSLRNILTNGWLNNSNNFIVRLSTEYENTLWQVFSVYTIPTTSDYLHINFSSTERYLNFLNMITSRSAYSFNTGVNESDKILTLSTCYNDNVKVVIHAKLIKREAR